MKCRCAATNSDECVCGAWDDLDPYKLKRELNEASAALAELMPFVLDEYWPGVATPEYRAAIERCKKVLEAK